MRKHDQAVSPVILRICSKVLKLRARRAHPSPATILQVGGGLGSAGLAKHHEVSVSSHDRLLLQRDGGNCQAAEPKFSG